jgi:hypothetical protein
LSWEGLSGQLMFQLLCAQFLVDSRAGMDIWVKKYKVKVRNQTLVVWLVAKHFVYLLTELSSTAPQYNSRSYFYLKMTVFWDFAVCSIAEVDQHFRGVLVQDYMCNVPGGCSLRTLCHENLKSQIHTFWPCNHIAYGWNLFFKNRLEFMFL